MLPKNCKHILIIGAAGGLAKITARLITKIHPHINITGVDSRTISDKIKNEKLTYKKMQYTRSNFESIFRNNKFDCVLLLGRIGQDERSTSLSVSQKMDINLIGTKRVLDLSLKFNVKKILLLSTYHVYGALSDNPVFINEDNSLKAAIKYPELRGVVETDQTSTTWMWKHQEKIKTILLRPCSILGPQLKNTMTRYLTTNFTPICADFNPMFQFIYELDMANIIIKGLFELPTGIYNVAPDDVISLHNAKKHLKKKTIPIPSFTLTMATKILNNRLWSFPEYLIDYIKFSCIIDNRLLKEKLGENLFRYTIKETLELSKLD